MTIDYSAGASLAEAITTCQTALASLQRLGRSADADTLLTDAEATSYDAILNDGTRSDAWKLQTCAQRYTSVMATLARQLTAAATTAGNQDADDAARVYGIKGLAGDVASLSISRRDAGDRVASITDTVQRQRLLAQATRTGDDVLAHAIVEAAIASLDADTTNQFAAAYPALADAVQRLWDSATHRMTSADIATAWRLAALKPVPLKPLQNYEIAAAAAGNTSAGSWNA
jgi:hypothetical protein